ncbi:hypothetical protein FCN52_12840, partial [Enterococcus faecium]
MFLLSIIRCCLLIYASEEKRMEVEQIKYQGMDRERLIDIIEQQRLELIQKEAVCKEYKKHLEQVIEYHSVEKYRSV